MSEMFNEIKKDIVIIGAGPAGSVFASKIAEHGFSVLLINGQTEKNKKPCGGLLAPSAQLLFAKENKTIPKDVLTDPQIFHVKTIDLERGVEKNYSRYYLNMKRDAFDKFLLDAVPDEVEKIDGRCTEIKKNDSDGDFKYQIYATTEGGAKIKISANVIVGADGASSIVRKKFYPPMKQYVAIQEWYKRGGIEDFYFSCIFDEVTSESCSWTICKEDNFIYGGCFDIKDGREQFEKQKARFEEKTGIVLNEKIKREACLVNVPEKKKDFVTGKDNVYLAGEAAGFISASSFEGISSAIKSGTELAKCISRFKPAELKDVNVAEQISKEYKNSCKKLIKNLRVRILKKKILFNPHLREIIMKSGMQDIGEISKG